MKFILVLVFVSFLNACASNPKLNNAPRGRGLIDMWQGDNYISLCTMFTVRTTDGYYISTEKGKAVVTEAALDTEIKNTQDFNQKAQQHNQKTQEELRVMEEELSKLSSNSKKSESTKAALVREQSKFKVLAVNNKKMLNNLEAEYAVKKDFLAKNSQRASSDKKLQSLNTETEMLSKNIQQLKDSDEQLAKMDNRLSM